MIHTTTLFTILLAFQFTEQHQKPCSPRSFGLSSVVCVCNATYCDNIPKPKQLPSGQYLTYTSTLSGLRFSEKQRNFRPVSENQIVDQDVEINVDSTQKYQNILGWGGAFTDSTGININSLNSAAADNLLRSYFSEEGVEYNLCRVPIGGTDFSTHGYSYNDGDEDPKLSNFKLASEDFTYKIPLIKKAQNLTSSLQLIAAAWTAPKWMKHNGKYTGPDFLRSAMYQPWANYHLKFLRNYKQEGIEFWGITTGNEPSTGLIPSKINSVGWLPWQMQKWVVEHLGPTIRGSEFSDLKIMAIDDQLFFYPWYIDVMFSDQRMKDYIDGFTLHWYWNRLFPHSLLTRTHNKYPDKFILPTEASEGSDIWEDHVLLGEWRRAETYAKDIIRDLNNWAAGWIDWNMALDLTGGPTYINNNLDSPIIVNATAGEFYKQPMYYALGHFSKFVPRGSYRISVEQVEGNMDIVGFKTPDNATVIVALNRNDEDVVIKIRDNSNAAEVVDLLPSRSIVTFLYW